MKNNKILMLIISTLLLSSILLPATLIIYSKYLYQPKNMYIVFNKDGALFEDLSISKMYKDEDQISQWLQDIVREAFTYNYLNVDKDIGDIEDFVELRHSVGILIKNISKNEEDLKRLYGVDFADYQTNVAFINREIKLSQYFSNNFYQNFRSAFFKLTINSDLKESKGKVIQEIIMPLMISTRGSYTGRKAMTYEGSIVLQKHSVDGVMSQRLNLKISVARVSLYEKSDGWEIVDFVMEER
jgi:hypothetical protein